MFAMFTDNSNWARKTWQKLGKTQCGTGMQGRMTRIEVNKIMRFQAWCFDLLRKENPLNNDRMFGIFTDNSNELIKLVFKLTMEKLSDKQMDKSAVMEEEIVM